MSSFNPGSKAQQNQTQTPNTEQQPMVNQKPKSDQGPGILTGSAFFGQSITNPTITRVLELLRNWVREIGENKIEILPLANNYGLRMGGLAICYPWESATTGTSQYLVQYVLFEETLPERTNAFTQMEGNRQIQLTVTPDDWVDARFLDRLQEVTATLVSRKNLPINHIGFNIVPREISANTNETQVYINLVSQTGEAFAQYIEYIIGEKAREKNSLKDLMVGRTLTLNVDTSGIQNFNFMNQPVRNDFTLTISAKETGSADGLFDAGIIPLTQTNGYIDVTYYEMSDAERMNAQFSQHFQPGEQYRRFVATGVITDIQSLRGIWDIDSVVNAFLSIVSLTENRQWAALLQRRYSNSSGARLRDVGSLSLEVDPTTGVIDTASTQYDEVKHIGVINALFRPRFDFAIELPRQSAYGFFRQLLRGAEVQGSLYYKAFVRALNEYTNGIFPLDYNGPIITLDSRPVLMGSYSSSSAMGNQSRHDIRDWQDYMTVLTQIGQSDIDTVKEFDRALAGSDGKSLPERTTTVMNIIERMAGDIQLTGKGDRYNISATFLETLVAACKAANLTIQTRTIGQMASVISHRRTSDQLGVSAFANGGVGVFSTNTQNSFGIDNSGGGLNFGFGLK